MLAKPPFPILQRGHPQSQGLLAGYPTYEGSGPTLHDLSGNDGTLNGGATWTPGPNGWCLSFPGAAGSYVGIGAAFTVAVPYTIIISGYLTATNGNWELLFGKDSGTGFWVTNTLAMEFVNGAAFSTSANASSLNAWHHYAVTIDNAGNNRIYIDAVSVASSGLTFGSLSGWRYFGAGPVAGNGIWTGQLDSPKIYQFDASPAQIAADYADSFAYCRPKARRFSTTTIASSWRRSINPRTGRRSAAAMAGGL